MAAYMDPLKLTHFTVHCAATPEGRDNSAQEVTKWDIARFDQPSYHWVIELDGTRVRTLRDNERGAHTAKHNTGNIGVCYVGGTKSFNAGGAPKDTRTPAQKKTLKQIILEYKERSPGIIVLGHNEWPGVAKACPSFSVKAWLAAGMPTS